MSHAAPDAVEARRGVIRRLVGLLPVGTTTVAAGLVVLGAASYVHLAIAGYVLSDADHTDLSVLWSIVFSVGIGLFLPIEQEITRIISARRATGDGNRPVFRRGFLLAIGMLGGVAVLMLVLAGPLAHTLFNGHRSELVVLGCAFAGLAVAHPTRGVLAGTGKFGTYGTQLAVDGGLRMVLAAAFGVFGVRSPIWFGLILAVAPIISVLVTAPAVRSALTVGSELAFSALGRGVAPLVISTLLSQLMVNIAVINVKLLDPGAIALINALIAALVLVRIPVFVFASMQSTLLPGLSSLVAGGDRPAFHRLLRRACVIVGGLGIASLIPATAAGPWLIHLAFHAPNALGPADFALLSLGTSGYLVAVVLGQGVMALGRHKEQTLAWVGGTLVLAAVTVLPGVVRWRVELGYTAGTVSVALALLALLLWRRPATVVEPPMSSRVSIPRQSTGAHSIGCEPPVVEPANALFASGGID